MKIYNKVKIDMNTGEVLVEDSFEYDGPLALACDITGIVERGMENAGVPLPGHPSKSDMQVFESAMGCDHWEANVEANHKENDDGSSENSVSVKVSVGGGCGDSKNAGDDNDNDSSTGSTGDPRNGGNTSTSKDDDPNNDHRDDGLH